MPVMIRLGAVILCATLACDAAAPSTIQAAPVATPAAGAKVPNPARITHDVSGGYRSGYGEVRLQQAGRHVTGTYVCCGGGTIDGTLGSDGRITYRWTQPGSSGRGVWTAGPGGQLLGTWGTGDSATSGGRWDLAPVAPELERAE